jgi:hypothetical protein
MLYGSPKILWLQRDDKLGHLDEANDEQVKITGDGNERMAKKNTMIPCPGRYYLK